MLKNPQNGEFWSPASRASMRAKRRPKTERAALSKGQGAFFLQAKKKARFKKPFGLCSLVKLLSALVVAVQTLLAELRKQKGFSLTLKKGCVARKIWRIREKVLMSAICLKSFAFSAKSAFLAKIAKKRQNRRKRRKSPFTVKSDQNRVFDLLFSAYEMPEFAKIQFLVFCDQNRIF